MGQLGPSTNPWAPVARWGPLAAPKAFAIFERIQWHALAGLSARTRTLHHEKFKNFGMLHLLIRRIDRLQKSCLPSILIWHRGTTMIDKYKQYIRYGEECVEIAKQTRDRAQQVMLMHIAETWLRLAETEEENRVLH